MATEAKVAKVDQDREVEGAVKDFGSFKFERLLAENSERRMMVVLGSFPDHPDHPDAPAVVIVEKTPFGGEEVARKILTGETKLKAFFRNDIYGKYDCLIRPEECNMAKVSLVYPATAKHVRKYESSPRHLVYETPAMHAALTAPYLDGEKFDLRWLYNILNHKQESESIVFEDTDCDDGFVLLPDYKWNGKQLEDLYLVAIAQRRDVRSLRDLRACHLPLLENMWESGCKAIHRKYGVPQSQIRAYFHYQPSYYHLHAHFTLASYTAPGCAVEGAHLLPMVIRNLRADPHHYARATLPFPVKESDNLFGHYKKNGYDFGVAESRDGESGDSDTPASTSPSSLPAASLPGVLSFFRLMGRAKHEPCGEHWTVTYGESAWMYRKMVEFEETLLQFDELKKEGETPSTSALLKSMFDVGFPGCEKARLLGDAREANALMAFLMRASALMTLKRTGWVRSGIEEPETVASHMFRMGVMAMTLEEAGYVTSDAESRPAGDAVVIALLHDLAEAIVGDITPKDKVPEEEKHRLEVEAMRELVKDLPGPLAAEIYTAFDRYEEQREGDLAARLTKDLDKLDMLLQADEYEAAEPQRGPFLQEFFDSTEKAFRTPPALALAGEIRRQRGRRLEEQSAGGGGDANGQ